MLESSNYRKHFRLSLFTSTDAPVDKTEAKQPLMRVILTRVFHDKKDGWGGSVASFENVIGHFK